MGFHERIDKDPTIIGEHLIFFPKKDLETMVIYNN
jgi:hypothetical protein